MGGQEGLPQRSGWEPRKGWSIPATSPASPPRTRQQLSEEELERLEEACDMALELNASKHRIYEYVESRMSFIAPNLSIIIGASTAAKIMGELGRGEGASVSSARWGHSSWQRVRQLPLAAAANDHKLSSLNNGLSPHGSGQRVRRGLPGLRSGCRQGRVPVCRVWGGSVSWPFAASWGACGPWLRALPPCSVCSHISAFLLH